MERTQKRVVFYQCLIGGVAQERVGVFDVTFDAGGLPVSAEMPRFVGFRSTKELVEFYDEVEKAILDLESLHCPNVLDLDGQPWDGSLTFEPETALV